MAYAGKGVARISVLGVIPKNKERILTLISTNK